MIKTTENLKHAAAVIVGEDYTVYCREDTTPTGTYHWARSKDRKPPILSKITRLELTDFNTGNFKYLREVTIWKRGQHHIKGARKTARARKAA